MPDVELLSINEARWRRRTERLEAVLHYIEHNLGETLDVPHLACLASISPFHFHRVFSSYVGQPVLSYVRRLRLERAAWLILFRRASVTEAALAAGYGTTAAFTRAFTRHFGLSPLRMTRQLLLRRQQNGVHAPLPRGPQIRELAPLDVIGIQRVGPYNQSPWEAWSDLRQYLTASGQGNRPHMRIGIPLDWPEITKPEARRYEACVAASLAPRGRIFRKQVPGGLHAVFEHRGPYEELQGVQESLYWHWLPRSSFRPRMLPALHIYLDQNPREVDPRTLRTEICMPIEPVNAGAGEAWRNSYTPVAGVDAVRVPEGA
jgi:AraC family transcriptional regulator